MQSQPAYQFAQRDDTPATTARRSEIAAGFAANELAGNAPYAGVAIRTTGELQWVMDERHWSGLPNPRGMARADLRQADFHGATLQEAALFEANLQQADCSGSCLQRADLRWVNCQDVNLDGADLDAAILFGANLQGANLHNATLLGANGQGTNMRAANLTDTDLHGATLRWATIDAVSLGQTNVQAADVAGVHSSEQTQSALAAAAPGQPEKP